MSTIRPPDGVQLLDSFNYDTDLPLSLEPMLGDRWIKLLAIYDFPTATVSALLDRLISLPIEYRWTSRFLCLNKQSAETSNDSSIVAAEQKTDSFASQHHHIL